jgi:AmmeMemoRadiSam system protein B
MIAVRAPAVAGRFYPDDPAECARTVDRYLADAEAVAGLPLRALVAPHAGFVYSGPVAATAYARLALEPRPGRVLILGPAHTVPLRAMAVTGADAWTTPLGDVVIDHDLREVCLGCAATVRDDMPHTREHSIEVHLPFLQRVLGDFTFVPIVVGAVPTEIVADLLEAVWDLDDVMVVVSTDLSHFHDHSTATGLDRRTADAIVSARFDALDHHAACGVHPLRGLLRVVAGQGLTVEELDVRNSGDTAGDRTRVVGYGAFAVTEPAPV